jgi:hypothetical protein
MMIAMFFDLRRLRNLLGHTDHVEQQWHMLQSHGIRSILTVTNIHIYSVCMYIYIYLFIYLFINQPLVS